MIPLAERFWLKVDTDGPVSDYAPHLGPCWIWTASLDGTGYGKFSMGSRLDGTRKLHQAHRVAYELEVGPIPPGLELDHLCMVRRCVRPSHAEPCTSRVNTLRSPSAPTAINARKTHCVHGHPLDGVKASGSRYCLTCNRDRVRALRAREDCRAYG